MFHAGIKGVSERSELMHSLYGIIIILLLCRSTTGIIIKSHVVLLEAGIEIFITS